MVLVCPHCASRSRVDDVQAREADAEVHCGRCRKSFFVRAAHKEASAPQDGSPKGPSGGISTFRDIMRMARALAFVGLPLMLLALCLYTVRDEATPFVPARADVRVAAAQTSGPAAGLAFREVHIDVHHDGGGAKALTVRGDVVNSGTAAATFVPEVIAQAAHPGLGQPITQRLAIGATNPQQQGSMKGPSSDGRAPAPVVLQPGQGLAFSGLVTLPQVAQNGIWDVLVTWGP